MNFFSSIKKIFIKGPKRYPLDTDQRIDFVINLGEKYGWTNPLLIESNKLISLFKDEMRINVFYTTFTVATCLNHPLRGKTQLFRKNVMVEELIKIFEDPRVHTQKGFYKKYKKWNYEK